MWTRATIALVVVAAVALFTAYIYPKMQEAEEAGELQPVEEYVEPEAVVEDSMDTDSLTVQADSL